MKYSQNENGISLIEVVASLAIITLILLSFSQFFIQAKKTSAYNNEKIVTINLADGVLARLQNRTYTNLNTSDLSVYFQDTQQSDPLLKNPPTAIQINDKVYTVTYKLSQAPEKLKKEEVPISYYSEAELGLIKVVVTVTSPNGKTKGSSEGYVVIE